MVVQAHTVQLGVVSVAFKQFTVRTNFQQLSVVHHHNPIGMLHRRQAVCDDQGSTSTHQSLQSFLNHAL